MEEPFDSLVAILARMQQLSKPRKAIITHLLGLFLSINHRINFLQLARHSSKYVESSYRLHFEAYFDFTMMNQAYIEQHGSGHYVEVVSTFGVNVP